MQRACFASLFLCLTAALLVTRSNPVPPIDPRTSVVSPIGAAQPDLKAQAVILDGYGKLPLSFEANRGQADARVKFLSRAGGYTLFLTSHEAVLALRAGKSDARSKSLPADRTSPSSLRERKMSSVFRMRLRNANPTAKVTGVDELPGTSNYFVGNDPAKWRTTVPTYARVKYEGIYPGIDLVYYGNQRQLEYDFIVAPGADPRRITFDLPGTKLVNKNGAGDLVLKTGEDEIRCRKPFIYQEKDGARQAVAGRYSISNASHVGFELAKYDPSRPLYIDPVVYSTYLGGSGQDQSNSIAVDSAGNAYITGSTASINFPVTAGAFQTVCGDPSPCANAFVTKLNPSGSALVYSAYLGGSGNDSGSGIAVDSAGNVHVTGLTTSTDFPTVNPLQPALGGGSDAFVATINSTGSALVYSTFLGGTGTDQGSGIAVDASGDAFLVGYTASTDFPVTPGSFQTVCSGCPDGDAFIAEINPSGSALMYSTFLGGSAWSSGSAIAVDAAGNAYVTGTTQSTNFPTTPGAFQTTLRGDEDAFVTEINPAGSALVYSTFLGGAEQDGGTSVALDNTGTAYVTGFTASRDFPTTHGALQKTLGGESDAFVAKLKPSGSALVYSTYLGGQGNDVGLGIALDSSGNAYVIGSTSSSNFPTKNPLQTSGGTAFVSEVKSSGSVLVFSTYLGGGSDTGSGIAVDNAGSAYITGNTSSTDFPTINPLQAANGGGADAFVAKITADVMLSPQFLSWVCTATQYCNQPVGTTSSPLVSTLINTGSATLHIASIGVTGANSGDYAETNTCGTSLSVGGSCNFSVTFTPAAAGPRNAAVSIADNLSDSPQLISLTGFGAQAIAEPYPSSLDFGNQQVGYSGPQQYILLYNTGDAWMYVTSVSIAGANSGDFYVSSCGGNDNGGDCQVAVTFAPTAAGYRSAEVVFVDNALGSPQTVPVSGYGTTPYLYVYLSPSSLSFGPQPVGTTSRSQTVQLSASGAINITSITTSAEFAETNNCGSGPVTACQISVTFAPSAIGPQSGTLTISDNGQGSPQTISLSGTGSNPISIIKSRH